jgi:hypothetical protein
MAGIEPASKTPPACRNYNHASIMGAVASFYKEINRGNTQQTMGNTLCSFLYWWSQSIKGDEYGTTRIIENGHGGCGRCPVNDCHGGRSWASPPSWCRLTVGEACLAHCLILLGEGDKEMAECAKSVNQMLAICGSLHKLASQNSAYTARFAKLAADVCSDCEKACRKHEKKHAECKACAEACAACLKECKAVAVWFFFLN